MTGTITLGIARDRRVIIGTAEIPASAVTARIIRLAAETGLNPHVSPQLTYRGAWLVYLDGQGENAMFGGIYINGKGRILRAALTRGNQGAERKYTSVAEVRDAIKAWAAYQRDALRAPGPYQHYGCQGCNGTHPLTIADRQDILGQDPTQYDDETGRPFCTNCLADLPASRYDAGFHVCGQQTASDIQAAIERAA